MWRRSASQCSHGVQRKVTSQDVEDLGRLLRPRQDGVSEIVEGWQGAALLIAIVWATFLGIWGKTNPNWWAVAAIWVVIVAIFAWTVRTAGNHEPLPIVSHLSVNAEVDCKDAV